MLAVAFIAILNAGPLIADNSTVNESDAFVEKIGRPASISFYQPIYGLVDELYGLDHDGLLDRDTTWQPFYEKDVWVYVVLNSSELSYMPEKLMKVIGLDTNPPKSSFTRYEANFGELNEKKLLIVIMMDGLLGGDLSAYRCKIAQSIYWSVTMKPETDLGALLRECD
jgi:hypothetical protein